MRIPFDAAAFLSRAETARWSRLDCGTIRWAIEMREESVTGTLVTFEGYDGAGKTTLIEAVSTALGHTTRRVVGRKNEPELQEISGVIEAASSRPHPEVELLLRIGLEMERGHVIADAQQHYEMVWCDRGVISLVSWFDYLGVSRVPFEPLVRRIEDRYRDTITIVCSADFDTCWGRVSDRPHPSPKEQLGSAANRRFFSMYEANVARIRTGV